MNVGSIIIHTSFEPTVVHNITLNLKYSSHIQLKVLVVVQTEVQECKIYFANSNLGIRIK
jgi:hypothetical protein